jgi:hypothetical protein
MAFVAGILCRHTVGLHRPRIRLPLGMSGRYEPHTI